MSTLLRGNKPSARASRNSRRGGRGGRTASGAADPVSTGSISTGSDSDDPFREERLKNAAKREGIKAISGGKNNNNEKKVRFSPLSPASSGSPTSSRDSSAEPTRRIPTTTTNSTLDKVKGKSATSSTTSQAGQNNNTSKTMPASTFGAPSHFGSSNKDSPPTAGSNPFSKPASSQPITNGVSVFGLAANPQSSKGFGSNAFFSKTQTNSVATTFGEPSTSSTSNFSGFGNQDPNSSTFGSSANGAESTKLSGVGSPAPHSIQTMTNGVNPFNKPRTSIGTVATSGAMRRAPLSNGIPAVSTSKLALDVQNQLRKAGIAPPSWPMKLPGDPEQKGAVESHWRNYKGYRAKARVCLIKNNLIDDPDKPKKLSEAIDFKGICEEMCPEFEKITRIMESDVKGPEKELVPGQAVPWPAPNKMIKALARSAAGQDAPLPEDVRSPAALRRTLDYLMDVILTEESLPEVHGFLWDRTRAIRRDFTFQAQSMNTEEELLDQVYCLEQITRFHVISLHQMSPRRLGEKITEDFSEQQEVEQLGKALLSLTHAYQDCKGVNVKCENEAEFRSYYVVFNAHYPGIMETVQDWGWEFWGESDEIRTAVMIVEALQNTWDEHGPLKPETSSDIAQNAYSKFFSIIRDPKISYTMACFAEIHFNHVRKSALRTITTAYRKQRDQTKEWTLGALSEVLQFDEDEEVEKFCESYGLTIQGSRDDEPFLSLEEEYTMDDPFPKLSQLHSSIVEQKRGDRSLQDAIHRTIFEEIEDDSSMFVRDTRPQSKKLQTPKSPVPVKSRTFGSPSTPSDQQTSPASASTTKSLFPFPNHTFTESSAMAKPVEQTSEAGNFFNKGTTSPASLQAPSLFAQNPTMTKPPEPKTVTFDFSPQSSSLTPAPAFSSPAAFSPPLAPQKQQETIDFGNIPPTSLAKVQIPKPTVSPAPVKLPDFRSLPNTKSTPSSGSGSFLNMPLTSTTPEQPPPASTLVSGLPASSTASPLFNAPAKDNASPAFQMPQMPAAPLLPVQAPRPPPLPPLESRLPAFSEWFAMGKDGIIDNFMEYQIENILLATIDRCKKDDEERLMREEENRARQMADDFRRRSLSVKYSYLWREKAHILWRQRQALEGRRMRLERLEELRAARDAAQAVDIAAEFTAATQRTANKRKRAEDVVDIRSSKRRNSEERLRATGVFDFVHDPNEEIRNVINPGSALVRSERSESPLVLPLPTSSDRLKSRHMHSRSQSQAQMSMSAPLRLSYLESGSRSLLLPTNWNDDQLAASKSNVKTDYFRMKARGIMSLPNGAPIPNTVAKHLLKQKRSSDGIVKNTSLNRSFKRSEPRRSVPGNSNGISHDDGDDALSQLKQRAATLMNGESETLVPKINTGVFDAEEEELFAKAKRVREQMDEGAQWYKEEAQRESMASSRSSSRRHRGAY